MLRLMLVSAALMVAACNYVQSAESYLSAPFKGSPFTTVTDIPLAGGADRLDYESLDADRHLLFVAHLGSSMVHVIDTGSNTVKATIGDIASAHGVLAVPALKRAYATATSSHELVVIDEDSLKVIARVPAGNAPDGLAYAPNAHAIFISDEGGSKETVVDVSTNQTLGQIELGGEAGNTQYDAVSDRIYVNVEPKDEIAEIDPATRAVVARHPVPGAGGAHGLLLDSANRQAYVAGEAGGKLSLVDMNTWQVLDTQPVGAYPDVLSLDVGRGLVYVAAESGTVSVFKAGQLKLQKIAEGYAASKAHVVLADPESHLLYLPLENVDGKPVLRICSFDAKP
ncbi:MAG: lactonase, 7-bladed beta-propeller family protein [Cyanobacteria bacterium RYN_339]|nr:lactonase, 7-bladed beta-propeller family protein [Cyanobacteria bacterium RYN_339]